MLKFNKITCVAICAVALLVSNANCMPIDVDVNLEKETITVSGEIEGANKDSNVTLTVIPKNAPMINLQEDKWTYTEDILYILQSKIQQDGKYEFTPFSISGLVGEYECIVQNIVNKEGIKKEVFIPEREKLNAFMEAVNNKDNTVRTFLDDEVNKQNIGIDINLYKYLTNPGRNALINKIFENSPYDGVSAVQEIINRYSVINGLLYADSSKVVCNYLNIENSEELQSYKGQVSDILSLTEYNKKSVGKKFFELPALKQEEVVSSVIQKKNGSLGEFFDNLSISVINYELQNAGGYNEVSGIINKYSDMLSGLKLADYNNFIKRNTIDKELYNNKFSSLSELSGYINNRMSELKEAKNSSSGGGGGSSSSSSGSGKSMGIAVGNTEKAVEKGFSDMGNASWAVDAVNKLVTKGIASGMGDGKFEPNSAMKREEFITMLVKLTGVELSNDDAVFDDVKSNSWYKKYVVTAYNNGYVSGIDAENFGIGNYITRQDMAVILYRALKLNSLGSDIEFTDSDEISDYAIESVSAMKQNNIISGYTDGSFKPHNSVTRAEAAVVLSKLIDNFGR